MARKVDASWKFLSVVSVLVFSVAIGTISTISNQRYANLQKAHLESLERQSDLYDRLARVEVARITGESQQLPQKPQTHNGLILAMTVLCSLTVLSSGGIALGLKILSNRQQLEYLQAMHRERLKALQTQGLGDEKSLKSAAVSPSDLAESFIDITPKQCEWIKDFTAKAFHFRVNGPTGSGKSTFIKNLMDMVKLKMQIPHIEDFFTIIDPKYPLSDWGSMVPKYQSIDEALTGIFDMYRQMNERLQTAKDAKSRNLPVPKFPPSFWLIDEVDWVMLEHGKKATSKFKNVLKVGRALNMVVVFFGQSPLCSDLGLRKNDFNNCGSIFLGSKNASMGVDEVVFKASDKKRLQTEIADLDESQVRYFALVKVDSSPAYIAPLPPPNFIEHVLQESSAKDAILIQPQPVSSRDSNESLDSRPIAPKALPETVLTDLSDSPLVSQNLSHRETNTATLSVPVAPKPAQPEIPSSLSEDELKRLKTYWELKEKGVTTKKDLVAKIYPDINGADKQGSYGYRKALKKLKALPGVNL